MGASISRPVLRWLVPTAAAVVVIGGGAAAGTLVANADPALPERSAAQLLVDVQTAKVGALSGTVVQQADLGLPPLSGLGGDAGATGGMDLMKLVTGNNTARVWYAGEDKARVAVQSALGQSDVIRNGTDVWLWQSRDNTATHIKLPAGARAADTPRATPSDLPSGLPSTPQDAAAMALAAIDPTTAVSTSGAAKVAGRAAYELVLAPRDTASLVGQVRIAIDGEHRLPLRVEVYAKNTNAPAVRVAFEQISFVAPDAQQFAFNPPPGAKVTTRTAGDHTDGAPGSGPNGRKAPHDRGPDAGKPASTDAQDRTVVGKGWTSVLVTRMPAGEAGKAGTVGKAGKAGTAEEAGEGMIASVIESLPKVNGGWGSGRLLSGTLFSVLLTDDGRLLAGAVAPEKLYEVAAKK